MTNPGPTLRLLFAGTPDFAERHLDALLDSRHEVVAVLTQPDRPAGRGKKLQPSPVKQRALAAGVDVLQPVSLKDPQIQQHLAELEVDAMIVVAYGLILPRAVLEIPRYGCLNVHASVLPRWRGAAPIQRAVEAGDPESGVSIMQMDVGLDTGPVLAVSSLALEDTETGGSLHDRLAALGPPALLSVLDQLETALARAVVQDDSLANYARKIDKAECQIDWSQPAEVLARRIRAFNPAPVCFSYLGDDRVKIWLASADANPPPQTPPGTIVEAGRDSLRVACGEGSLSILQAQFPGGKALTAAQLINGKADQLTPGARFTDTPATAP